MAQTVVSVERVIKAPAAAIFAIVADASRHPPTSTARAR